MHGCGVEFAEDDLVKTTTTRKTYAEKVCDDCGAFHCLITDIWAGNASSISYMAVSRGACSIPEVCVHQFILI